MLDINLLRNNDMIILFITDNWGYTKGGINTVNYELCKSLASLSRCKVYCAVSTATQEEINTARDVNVTIVNIDSETERINKNDVYKLCYYFIKEAKEEFIWIIGHDVITGEVAINLNKIFKDVNIHSECAIIHHMDYSKYMCFKEGFNKSDKITKQEQILRTPKVLFAIGPRLLKSAETLNENLVVQLMPGLNFDNISIFNPKGVDNFDIAVSGRITKDDDIIKQASLVVQAFAFSSKDVINSGKLSLFGANEDEVNQLRDDAYKKADKKITINPYKYTSNRTNYIEQLKRKHICIMPSLEEGFGLVAWEAIGLGVPVIISKNAGVYDFFNSATGCEYKGLITVVETDSENHDKNVEDLKKAIIDVYKNYKSYKDRAVNLRDKLNRLYTWNNAASDLLDNLERCTDQHKEVSAISEIEDEKGSIGIFKTSIGEEIANFMQNTLSNCLIKYNNNITFKENCSLWCNISQTDDSVIIREARIGRIKAFDKKYGHYNYDKDLRKKYSKSWFLPIKSIVDQYNTKQSRVIGVGSNNGDELIEIFGTKHLSSLTVLDISEEAIKLGQNKYKYKNFKFAHGCMEEHFPEVECFDLYLNLRSIHSRGVDFRSALSECKRILKPGGVAIFSVANGYLLEDNKTEVYGMYDNDLDTILTNTPYAIVEKIRIKLEFYGFYDIEIHTGKSEIFIKAVKNKL